MEEGDGIVVAVEYIDGNLSKLVDQLIRCGEPCRLALID